MKVYLAARYTRYPEMQVYARQLEQYGYTVVSSWITGDNTGEDGEDATHETRRELAMRDIDQLRSSDICISFTEPPRTTATRGGRHVEFGIAYALNKIVWVCEHRENIFHDLGRVRFFPTWLDCLRAAVDVAQLP